MILLAWAYLLWIDPSHPGLMISKSKIGRNAIAIQIKIKC